MEVVLITGAGTGIGAAAARLFAKSGYKVYGLARNAFDIEGVTSIVCDMGVREQIVKTVDWLIKKEGQVDILVNNAGMGIFGASEFSDSAQIERIMNVNFLGAVTLTNFVLPYMRSQGGGRIINTSSIGGFIPLPFQSFYSASKAALESWAKALSVEVKPFNIKITNLQCGDVKTDFTKNREKSKCDTKGIYSSREEVALKHIEHDEQNGMKPDIVAKAMLKVIRKKHPPLNLVVGFGFRSIKLLTRVCSERVVMGGVKIWYHIK
ncbi:MAG: SDR family NAD(P)-dependent oxidoreductase [Christensenellaceae bacterium]|jgi:short-subunit dehydrogenase|nr:SDR family NAD(P)-dependent oxidoreductase [Christensenellaceae bacterium]